MCIILQKCAFVTAWFISLGPQVIICHYLNNFLFLKDIAVLDVVSFSFASNEFLLRALNITTCIMSTNGETILSIKIVIFLI